MEGQRGSNSSLSSGNGNEVAADASSSSSCFYVPNPSGTDFDAESSAPLFISTSKMSYGAIKRVELIIGAPLNAERSDSSTVGWDGPAGYVYQKAYLEFLCSKDKLDAVVEICKALPCVAATNRGANWVSNTAQSDVNAVTCGVFPAKGIIQPTIVD
ncbi:hypothetical protein F2Q68_00012585 [Brassica cretica]|uniref:MTHFR SAM-binding regulatory domain-containing protein n=1 Tax=Brassica cretica TaxID=69181 RepID=A0A8S9KW12_BRACR|nr:hypothetical protein F2Q68_00012585 [Brassica cretica]